MVFMTNNKIADKIYNSYFDLIKKGTKIDAKRHANVYNSVSFILKHQLYLCIY